MAKKIYCTDCGKVVPKDVIALNKKLIDMNAQAHLCIECMSEFFGCSVADLNIKIDEFKEQGCTLFF